MSTFLPRPYPNSWIVYHPFIQIIIQSSSFQDISVYNKACLSRHCQGSLDGAVDEGRRGVMGSILIKDISFLILLLKRHGPAIPPSIFTQVSLRLSAF